MFITLLYRQHGSHAALKQAMAPKPWPSNYASDQLVRQLVWQFISAIRSGVGSFIWSRTIIQKIAVNKNRNIVQSRQNSQQDLLQTFGCWRLLHPSLHVGQTALCHCQLPRAAGQNILLESLVPATRQQHCVLWVTQLLARCQRYTSAELSHGCAGCSRCARGLAWTLQTVAVDN